MSIRLTQLGNGLVVVSERVPHLQSATVGLWVGAGSRTESPRDNGIGHFIEHMLFKGTERRKALDISREIESVGGTINAYTEREYVFVFAKVLSRDFPLAADLLGDIYLNSLFDGEELERERDVVLQEILMVEDSPEEALHDYFHESYWGGHPLGLPVQGTPESVRGLTRDRVTDYFVDRFRRKGIVLSVVGDVPHETIEDAFGRVLGDVRLGDPNVPESPPVPTRGSFLRGRSLEQVHVCLGAPAVPRTSERRHAALVLNAVLGGSMSSRLFQEVREKRGLAYSVYSCLSSYADAGIVKIGASTTREKVRDLLAVTGAVLDDLREGGVTDGEVATARELIRGGMVLGLESAEYRMSRNALNAMFLGRVEDHGEEVRRVGEVGTDEVRSVAADLLSRDRFALAAVGDLPGGRDLAI